MSSCRVYFQSFCGNFFSASQAISVFALVDQFKSLVNSQKRCRPVAFLRLGHGLLLHGVHAR